MNAEARAKGTANLIPYKKGVSGNPKGKKRGQRDYATIQWEAMKKIAASRGTTPEEIEALLYQVGLTKSLKGEFNFYHDHMDRMHGKPIVREEHTGEDGGPIQLEHKVIW